MKKITAVLVTGVLFFSGTMTAGSPTRIMPLGDSITKGMFGSVYAWGYRKPLYDLLTAGNYNFDFVGSQTIGNFPDPEHEGHDGWTSSQILYNVSDWLNTYQPDVILLHIGTNDITFGTQDANTVNSILNAIDSYKTASGRNVMVMLALIINRRADNPEAKRAATSQFNNDVNAIAMNRIAGGDDIIVVNMEPALDYNISGDMADAVHPNDPGYVKMAQVWYGALTNYFSGMFSNLRGDLNTDGCVDYLDLEILTGQWLLPPDNPSADIAPQPDGNGIVDLSDFATMANGWFVDCFEDASNPNCAQ